MTTPLPDERALRAAIRALTFGNFAIGTGVMVMVGMLDSLSLKNTKLGLETLELMKYDTDHIYLLLNRAHSRVGISQSDVEAVLGRTPDVFIPSDREIPRTVNEGIPIVSNAVAITTRVGDGSPCTSHRAANPRAMAMRNPICIAQ